MRVIAVSLLWLMLGSGVALAGSVDVFPWQKSYLEWAWDGPADPAVTGFLVECGAQAGVYTQQHRYPPTVFRTTPAEVLPAPGYWFCIVTPMYGEVRGTPSTEYPFALSAVLKLRGGAR